MDRNYVIGVNIPNFVTIGIMAFGWGILIMLAKKGMKGAGNGN